MPAPVPRLKRLGHWAVHSPTPPSGPVLVPAAAATTAGRARGDQTRSAWPGGRSEGGAKTMRAVAPPASRTLGQQIERLLALGAGDAEDVDSVGLPRLDVDLGCHERETSMTLSLAAGRCGVGLRRPPCPRSGDRRHHWLFRQRRAVPGCRSEPRGSDDLGYVAVGVFTDAVEDGGGHPQDRAAEMVWVPIDLGVEEVQRRLLRF